MKNYIKITTLIFVIFLLQCTKSSNNSTTVTVSILPQKYFVEQIVGKKFQVNVMIPPGHNPAAYEPTIQQLQKVSTSTIYFRIGYIPFEITSMDKIKSFNKNLKVVDTSKGIELIKGHSHHHDNHNNHNTHDNRGIDPHIWMSPKACLIISKNIFETFSQIDPKNKTYYKSNYDSLIKKIKHLDNNLKNQLKSISKRKFFTYHPIWSYFSRDYGFEQIPIELEGKEPTISHIQKIIKTSRREKIKTIFIQKQFNKNGAETIAQDINGRVIVVDPLHEDWLNNMEQIAATLKKELGK